MEPLSLPIINATAHELQKQLASGAVTSVELVTSFLAQIARHNRQGLKLNAILSVCPADIAISQAARLDQERQDGRIRSALHGLPIVIKVRDLSREEVRSPLTG